MKSFYISYLKIECLLPSSALYVRPGLHSDLVSCFVDGIGISPPMYSKAFNPGVGISLVTFNNAASVSDETISTFLNRIDDIFKNKGGLKDDLYISLSERPGDALNYPGKKIYPAKSSVHQIGKGESIVVDQPITIENGTGLIVWDKDTFSRDDALFSIIPNADLIGDNCDLIYNAAMDCLFRVSWTCSESTIA
ncbi:MAG: hypothetical protein NE328_07430 [Lentisphaeraceae bacterium]|nr:hypothetical protein [Lentisphaeraceae bacterium]